MFKDEVGTLHLSHARIRFIDKDLEHDIPRDTLISDVAFPMVNEADPSFPDYVIRGYYTKVDHNKSHIFSIAGEPGKGSHLLYITGVPRGEPELGLLPNALWVNYCEDSKYGYLFQIILYENE